MSRAGLVPEVRTSRLRLRGWTDADRLEWPRIVGDPEVMRFLHPHRPLSPDEARAQLDRLQHAWELDGMGHWAVEERASRCLLGRVGLESHDDWQRDPEAVEVGWILRRSAWGKGFATEGGSAALHFAFETLGLDEVVSISDPRNHASLRVMEKLAFVFRGSERWRGLGVVWYGLTAARWREAAAADVVVRSNV